MQPNAFLSAALPAMLQLPLAGGSSSSSQAIGYEDPPACEAWTDVSEDWVGVRPLLYSRVTVTGGGSSSPRGSGSSSASGSRIPLEELAIWLTDNADEIFCNTSGAPLLVVVQQEENMHTGQRVNEAETCDWFRNHLLKHLQRLVNALLDRTNAGSRGGSSAAGGAARAGATAAPAGATSEANAVPAGATAGAGGGGTAWGEGVRGVAWKPEDRLHTEQVLECQRLGEGAADGPRLRPGLALLACVNTSGGSSDGTGAAGAAGAAASSSTGDGAAAEQQWCGEICLVEVEAAAALMENGSPIALLEKWEQKDPKVRAMIAQAYTCMSRGGIPYGILTDYHTTFLLRLARARPPPPPQPAAGSSSSRGPITRAAAAKVSGMAAAAPAANAGCGGGLGRRTLGVAGPFLATTQHTTQKPAATAATAVTLAMLLGVGSATAAAAAAAAAAGVGAHARSPAYPQPHPQPGSGPGPAAAPKRRAGDGGGDERVGTPHDMGLGGSGAGPAGGAYAAAGGGAAAAAAAMAADRGSRTHTRTGQAGLQDEGATPPQPPQQLQPRAPSQTAAEPPVAVALATAAQAAAPGVREAPSPLRVVSGALLCEGYAGIVCGGRVDGEEAVLKFLGPDKHGVAAYHRESSAYAALAALQGQALPRLLAAGITRTLVPAREDPQRWVPPPPPDRVLFLAASRVPGLTLRELLTRRGRIEPAVARAAVRALQQLHAAKILPPPGGAAAANDGAPAAAAAGGGAGAAGGGRFLHGDVKLSNFMVLLPPTGQPPSAPLGAEHGAAACAEQPHEQQAAGAESVAGVEGEARCIVIDLGLSRLDGSEEEQQAELRQLQELLRKSAGLVE